MKISIDQKTLIGALRKAKMAVKAGSIPALGCVLMQADGKTLTITATDLDRQLIIKVEASVVKEGELLISCERLIAVVDQIDGDVTIKAEDTAALVSGKGIKAKIFGLAVGDFPVIKALDIEESATFQMDGDELSWIFKRVGCAMAGRERQELQCLCLQVKDNGLAFVGSDGRRLHVAQEPEITVSGNLQVTSIPAAAVPVMMDLCKGGVARIVVTDRIISLTVGEMQFQTKLLELGFPNVWPLVPSEVSKNNFVIPRAELIAALGRVTSLNGDHTRVTSDASGILLESEGAGVGKVECKIAHPQTSKSEFTINDAYFRASLNALTADEVVVENLRSIDPVVMRETGFIALIMPIRNK